MQIKAKHNKGFTLVELVVALGVSVIVLGMISLSIYYLHSAFSTSKYVANSLNEYTSIKQSVEDVKNVWVEDGFVLQVGEQSELLCVQADVVKDKLYYSKQALYVGEKQLLSLADVTNVVFKKEQNNIIAVIAFSGGEQLQFIL